MNHDPRLRLDPLPMSADAEQRVRAAMHREARASRLALAETALHGGFALAAVVWAGVVVFG